MRLRLSARIYRTDESGHMDDGGRGNANQGGDVGEGKNEEDKDNDHHDEGEVLVDLVI